MLINQKKINIYIPIEVKKRELLSKIILSKFIINNNKKKARCYIGSKIQIKKLIFSKKSYGGIFIYIGGLPNHQIVKIKKKVEKYIILDEEMGPASVSILEEAMRKRLWVGTEKYVDRSYSIGKYHHDIGKKVFPKLSNKTLITGWPRVDLWRPEFSYIYNNSVESLKKKYGNFILFSCDFTFNSQKRIDREEEFWRNSEWKFMSENLGNIVNGAKKLFLEYQEVMKLLRKLDERTDIPQIIIRPHPSDDLLEWKKVAKSLKRIKVIFKGDVTPWIYASSGVLHRGCSSSIEAYMAGVPTAYIVTNKEWIRKSLPYDVSEHLYDFHKILEFCKSNINEKLIPPKEYNDAFKNIIHVEKKFACELIAEDILKLDVATESPHHHSLVHNMLDTSKVIFIKIKSSIIKFIKRYTIGALLPDKMLGGVTKKEIVKILNNFEPGHNLKVRQVITDCVEIE